MKTNDELPLSQYDAASRRAEFLTYSDQDLNELAGELSMEMDKQLSGLMPIGLNGAAVPSPGEGLFDVALKKVTAMQQAAQSYVLNLEKERAELEGTMVMVQQPGRQVDDKSAVWHIGPLGSVLRTVFSELQYEFSIPVSEPRHPTVMIKGGHRQFDNPVRLYKVGIAAPESLHDLVEMVVRLEYQRFLLAASGQSRLAIVSHDAPNQHIRTFLFNFGRGYAYENTRPGEAQSVTFNACTDIPNSLVPFLPHEDFARLIAVATNEKSRQRLRESAVIDFSQLDDAQKVELIMCVIRRGDATNPSPFNYCGSENPVKNMDRIRFKLFAQCVPGADWNALLSRNMDLLRDPDNHQTSQAVRPPLIDLSW